MDILSSVPSLSGTIFKDHDVIEARRVWAEAEKRYAPGWFDNPVGCLAPLFQSKSPRSAFLLIDIAGALNLLSNHNVTQDSLPVFKGKIRALMTEENQSAFDELLTEIMVAAHLCRSVSPIAFEPFVTKRHSEGGFVRFLRKITKTVGKQLASPDYAVVLPDGPVAIEVTVLHVGQLQSWQRRVNEIRDALKEKILRADGIYRDVELQLPLEFNRKVGNKLCERQVIDKILREEQGELRVDLGPQIAHLRWRQLTIYEQSSFDMRDVSAEVNIFAVTDSRLRMKNGFGFTSRPIGTCEQFEEFMFKSLTNTLARKHNQFHVKNHRYILILKLGHTRMPSELLHNLFRKRIWPNSKYNWLTCFGEFQPRSGYAPASPGHMITFQTNPNGEPLPGPFLEGLLDGGKTFHTHKGRIKAESRAETGFLPAEYPSPFGGFRGRLALWISKVRYIYKVINGQE